MQNYYPYSVMSDRMAEQSPSTVHTKNTFLFNYFLKQLLQELKSVYIVDVPFNWDKDYFIETVLLDGKCAIIDTKTEDELHFGVIPQQCNLSGFNVYRRPSKACIANPLIRNRKHVYEIDRDCTIIKAFSDFSGFYDLLSYYADLLSLTTESVGVNLLNSKLSYIFLAKNNASAESFKKLYDTIQAGNPAVVVHKSLFDKKNGNELYGFLNQNLNQNNISSDLMRLYANIYNQFRTDIGIPNVNFEKPERALVDEVNANNIQTMSKAVLVHENIKNGIDKACLMFKELKGKLSIKMRYSELNYDLNRGDEDV